MPQAALGGKQHDQENRGWSRPTRRRQEITLCLRPAASKLKPCLSGMAQGQKKFCPMKYFYPCLGVGASSKIKLINTIQVEFRVGTERVIHNLLSTLFYVHLFLHLDAAARGRILIT